uniref:Putative cell wall integrity and stress response component 1 n=1 Tax=Anopheles darlingi TaxID=43151 RepID=A0A2M4D2N3_ANODA
MLGCEWFSCCCCCLVAFASNIRVLRTFGLTVSSDLIFSVEAAVPALGAPNESGVIKLTLLAVTTGVDVAPRVVAPFGVESTDGALSSDWLRIASFNFFTAATTVRSIVARWDLPLKPPESSLFLSCSSSSLSSSSSSSLLLLTLTVLSLLDEAGTVMPLSIPVSSSSSSDRLSSASSSSSPAFSSSLLSASTGSVSSSGTALYTSMQFCTLFGWSRNIRSTMLFCIKPSSSSSSNIRIW